MYEVSVTDPYGCIKALRGALQNGPITHLFSGGGGGDPNTPFYTQPHQGFSMRMPADEIEQWTTVVDSGIGAGHVGVIPREVFAARVWDANTKEYVPVEILLDGAPNSDEAMDEWFRNVILKLKSSVCIGSDFLDELITCEGYEFDCNLSRPKPGSFYGKVDNRWTKICLATKP